MTQKGKFKFEIGQEVKDEKRDFIIVDREYRQKTQQKKYIKNEKWYKFICNKCGWTEGWIVENNLLNGNGCVCCAGQRAVLGINTIWDTDRWMCDLGVSEEDAKKYKPQSNQKIKVKCPDCGNNKEVSINNIYCKKSTSCQCKDGISYPEKFIFGLLSQLGLEFKCQYNPTWIKPKRYDFHIPEHNIIIEVHGEQHYNDNVGFKTSFKEVQENDKIKRELALNNGIKHYIELDCRCSDLNYIKRSILNSELTKLFDLSKIDWLICEEFALKNIVKEVCLMYNKKVSVKDISKKYNINIRTIRRYISKGREVGLIEKPKRIYNRNKENNKSKEKKFKKIKNNKNKVGIYKDDQFLGAFNSNTELEQASLNLFGVKLLNSKVSEVCTGKKSSYKGYKFKYI